MSHKRDSLVPIGKASSGLSVKAIRSTSPQTRHHFTRFDQVDSLFRRAKRTRREASWRG